MDCHLRFCSLGPDHRHCHVDDGGQPLLPRGPGPPRPLQAHCQNPAEICLGPALPANTMDCLMRYIKRFLTKNVQNRTRLALNFLGLR
jgi:hypothetical protein